MIKSSARRPALMLGAAGLLLLGFVLAGYELTAGPVAPFGAWQSLGRQFGARQDLGSVDFRSLIRRSGKDDALICPKNFCAGAGPETEPPVYTISATRLLAKLRGVALAEPRLTELPSPAPDRLRFVQRSALLRIPDVIDAQVIARSSGSSTVALYSRGALGMADFGANEGRLARWLDALSQ